MLMRNSHNREGGAPSHNHTLKMETVRLQLLSVVGQEWNRQTAKFETHTLSGNVTLQIDIDGLLKVVDARALKTRHTRPHSRTA